MAEFNPDLAIPMGAPARFERISPRDKQRVLSTMDVAPEFDPSLAMPLEEEPSMVKKAVPEPEQKPSLLRQAGSEIARPFKTTFTEFVEGGKQAFVPKYSSATPSAMEKYVTTPASQLFGAARMVGAPVTGFLYEPAKRAMQTLDPLEHALPPFMRNQGYVSQSAKDVAAETAGLGASFLSPSLSRVPGAVLEKTFKGPLTRLGEVETLTDVAKAERAKREAQAAGLGATLDPTGMTAKLQELTQTRDAAQHTLEQYPLRIHPDENVLKQTGERFVGTPTDTGLFRQAATGIKKSLSNELGRIITPDRMENGVKVPGQVVSDLSPIQDAATKILPTMRTTPMTTRPQSIAQGILDIAKGKNADELTRGELLTEEMVGMLQRNFMTKGRALNEKEAEAFIKNFMNVLTPSDLEALRATHFGPAPSTMPSLADIHGDRTMIRAAKRAAERTGQDVVKNKFAILEQGYTDTINNTLGKDGAKLLKDWDAKYAEGVKNVFGWGSLPYKLSKEKAEDFVASLFRKAGKGQEERVSRTMQLLSEGGVLSPAERGRLGETFLQTVTQRSQVPGGEFDPAKWGKEYLSYRAGLRNAALGSQHDQDLTAIAKTLSATPKKIKTLTQVATETPAEKIATERLTELGRTPTQRVLGGIGRYGEHRAVWAGFGALTMVGGHEMGFAPIMVGGGLMIGSAAMSKLLSNERGARLIRLAMNVAPNTAEASKYGAQITQLYNQLSLPQAPQIEPKPPTKAEKFSSMKQQGQLQTPREDYKSDQQDQLKQNINNNQSVDPLLRRGDISSDFLKKVLRQQP